MSKFITLDTLKTALTKFKANLSPSLAKLDSITGVVTADKLQNPDHPTDLVAYEAFQAAVPLVQSMNLTGAQVGQTIKVKAVNEQGMPTAWEAADMPSGGEHWEKITEIELTDAASLITINQDATGKPFALKRVMIDCTINIDQDNAMTYVKTLLNNMTVCNNKSCNFAASATGYYSFYAELIPGSGALAWQTAATNNYNWGGEILKMGYKYNNIWQSNAITSLTISPNDGGKNFGIAGTKIAVQGVRA